MLLKTWSGPLQYKPLFRCMMWRFPWQYSANCAAPSYACHLHCCYKLSKAGYCIVQVNLCQDTMQADNSYLLSCSCAIRPSSEKAKQRADTEAAWLNLHQQHQLPVHCFRLGGELLCLSRVMRWHLKSYPTAVEPGPVAAFCQLVSGSCCLTSHAVTKTNCCL